MLLDEPFGGLDGSERAILADQIRDLRAEGTTVVIVDHVLDDLFSVTDRVVAFDFGTPIAEGDSGSVIKDQRVLASYLGEGTAAARHALPRAGNGEPVVSLRGIAHNYDGVHALRGIDLEIAAGTVVGIVGANGAGKSTLGRIAAGLMKPSGGAVEFHGAPRRSLVPEGREIFKTLSVAENLEAAGYGAGLRGAALQRAHRRAAAVDARARPHPHERLRRRAQRRRAADAGDRPRARSRARTCSSSTSPRSGWRRRSWTRSTTA